MPKGKGKKKVHFHDSEAEKIPSPKLIKKSRTTKGRPVDTASLPTFFTADTVEEPIVVPEAIVDTISEEIPATTASVAIPSIATEPSSSTKSSKTKRSYQVISAPRQQVLSRAPLPPARPLGRILKGATTATQSGLDLHHCYKGNMTSTPGQLIITDEPQSKHAIQLLIDLSMESVNSSAEEQLQIFDEWASFRSHILAEDTNTYRL